MAVADAARRDPISDPFAGQRLRRLLSFYELEPFIVGLRASLSPSEANTVATFLETAHRRSRSPVYDPDRYLRWSADRAVGVLSQSRCDAMPGFSAARGGQQSQGEGTDSEDGRIYERRERESFLTRETVQRIAFGTAIAGAFIFAIGTFKFTKVLARRDRRHPCGLDCRLMLPEDRVVVGRVVDLSEGGCRISVNHKALGDCPSLTLVAGKLSITCEPVWISEQAVGLKFLTPIGPEQIDETLAQARAMQHREKLERRKSQMGTG